MAAAKKLNLKIGLASSSRISWIEPYLTKHHLAHYFDSICTADHVENVKPDAELYLQSINKLNVAANEAISFEDSLNGFRAAKAAGLHCVIVPNELTKDFEFSDYDLIMSSMKDKELNEVIDTIHLKSERV